MSGAKPVRIGMIGAGFLAQTRARCYAQLGAGRGRMVAVAARTPESARAYAQKHRLPRWFSDYRSLLALEELDVVDLCIPNHLHREVTEAAAAAGKHVICTKPLTAYTGQDLPANVPDREVSERNRRQMLKTVSREAHAMVEAADRAGVQLMYGENWIYSPSITKATALIQESKGVILEMRGGECHSGSHSPYSMVWRYTGGGALLRLGAHPIGAMLYLKELEGRSRLGHPIRPVSVSAEVADLTRIEGFGEAEKSWIATGWKDVETWAAVTLTFEDGAAGIVWASDGVLGGMESTLQVFLSNARLKCNLSPHDLVQAYAPDSSVFAGQYLMEKLETKSGWSTPIPDEDWSAGHLSMCRDFISAVAEDRPARSQGRLGAQVVRVVYAAYCSASEGRRVALQEM
ncbi:MAG: Gfo/Idh/MocA family protein [Acidobacteriota bacterium]